MASFTNKTGAIWTAVAYGSAQTDTAIVAAPGAGKKILLIGWKAAADTASDVTLEEAGTGLIDALYLAANGNELEMIGDASAGNVAYEEGVLLAENTALTVTTTGAGNVTIGVLYRVVNA